jgi:hypothetical protein
MGIVNWLKRYVGRHVKDDGFEKEGTMTLSSTPKTNTEKTTKDCLVHLRINQCLVSGVN